MTQPDISDSQRRAIRLQEAVWHLAAVEDRLEELGWPPLAGTVLAAVRHELHAALRETE